MASEKHNRPEENTMATIRTEDRETLAKIMTSGGGTLADVAFMADTTPAKVAILAKRYDGVSMTRRGNSRAYRLTLSYIGPQEGSFKEHAPGITNPRTGISARIPAEVVIRERRIK